MQARKILGAVANGCDPAKQRAGEKRASTLAEVAEQFLTNHVAAKRARNTAASYRDLLKRLVLPELGTRKAEKITSGEIHRLHSKLGDHPYQANRALLIMSSLFTYAGKAYLVPIGFNPCRGIENFMRRAENAI